MRSGFHRKPPLLQNHEIVENWPKKDFWRSSEPTRPYLWLVSILSQLYPTCASQPSREPPQPITGMPLLGETYLQSIVLPKPSS